MNRKVTLTLIICSLNVCIKAQTGIYIPQMATCDNLISNFLATYNIPGASFALAKDGKLVYHRAFGNANISGTEVTQPYHLFRIASLSKPITSIAIMNMVEQNKIALTDKVFGTGGLLQNHPLISKAVITDVRIFNITVQHLLEHTAGWDRNINCFPNPTAPYPNYFSGCDPIVAPLHVTQKNGTKNPVSEEDMIIFLLEKGLNYAPGTRYAYSNIGYLALGEIIEEKSGQAYEQYVKGSLLNQLGICDMHLGKNLPGDKAEREVEYVGNGFKTLSCYNTGSFVPWEYGGFNLEAMDAHGGWIATSRDLVRLLVAVDGFTTKPDILSSSTIATMTKPSANNINYAKGWAVNASNNWWHTGSLDGTATFMARTIGQYTWAVLLNKREIGANENKFWTDFDALPWNCISSASSFPAHDFLDIPATNSTNILFTSISSTSATVSWTNGNGNKRIVVARKNGAITNFPLDGRSYSANPSFALGNDLGNNIYVVYNGSGNSVNVTNLQPNTSYSFRVFEYNESANTGNNALYKLCGGDEKKVTTLTVTSARELSEDERVKIYPTVSDAFIHLEFPFDTEGEQYEIISIDGILFRKGTFQGNTSTINISDVQSGLYILSIKTKKGNLLRRKFIKI